MPLFDEDETGKNELGVDIEVTGIGERLQSIISGGKADIKRIQRANKEYVIVTARVKMDTDEFQEFTLELKTSTPNFRFDKDGSMTGTKNAWYRLKDPVKSIPKSNAPTSDGVEEQEEHIPGEAPLTYDVKAKAILLTYNLPLEIATPTVSPQDQQELFDAYVEANDMSQISKWSLCLEKGSRLHCHAYFESTKQFDCRLSRFSVILLEQNCPPSDVQCNKVKGSGYRAAADRGHFYVQCIFKNTHLHQQNNYQAGIDFSVKTQWINDLWSKGKIDDDKVLECAAYYKCLTHSFQDMVTRTVQKNKEIEKRNKIQKRRMELQQLKTPFKTFPEIDMWLCQYVKLQFRYNFLVVHGSESKLGKTELVQSYFKNPFMHKDVVCWTGYDDDKHDAVIFDDVKDIYDYILAHKALFQASGTAQTQTSATNMYARTIDVTQKPLIITSNHSPEGNWIMGNSVRINVDCKTYLSTMEEYEHGWNLLNTVAYGSFVPPPVDASLLTPVEYGACLERLWSGLLMSAEEKTHLDRCAVALDELAVDEMM